MQLKICFAYNVFSGLPHINEAKITQKSHLELSSDNLRPLEDFLDIAHKLADFMCFAIDRTVLIKNFVVTSTQTIDAQKPGPIYYESAPYYEKAQEKSNPQMLFAYKLIKINTETIINNWLRAYETLAPALYLYFSTQINTQKYCKEKFLALVQGNVSSKK